MERASRRAGRLRPRVLCCLLAWLWAAGSAALAADWPQFRGPGGRGVSEEKGLPREISQKRAIAWSVPLPGPGPASPIVVGKQVIITSASGPHQERLHVSAFDAATGQPRWQRTIWATGATLCNPFGGVAAPTPASDGKLICALFASSDLICFDLDGNLKWLRGLAWESPATRNDSGMGSSPVLAGDTVVVQLENPGASFAAGLDILSGQTRWRMPLESGGCWTTPVYLPGKTASQDLVVLQTRLGLIAIEPHTGRRAWSYDQPCSTISSTTAVTAGAVEEISPLSAARQFTSLSYVLLTPAGGLMALGSGPETAEPKLLWKQQRVQPENVSPVVCDGRVYVIKSGGILVCGELSTGKILWQLRLRGPIWATPVIADGHLYAVNYDGIVQVVRLASDGGEEVSSCELESGALATPAIAEGALYLRTKSRLWKIARPAVSAAAAAVSVVADGRPAAVVVTADQPTAVTRYAAAELVYHLEKATGARLPIVPEGALGQEASSRIYVGDCRAARQAGIVADQLAGEACVLKTTQNALFLVGDDAQGDPLSLDTRAGTLWGVYEWLERVLQVRWLWPGELGLYVPKTATVAARETNETIAPRFFQRKLRVGHDQELPYAELAFTAKASEQYARDQQVFLRRHRMGRSLRVTYGHAFTNWWEQYGKEHPEWFQLLDNDHRGPKKRGARYSMCVSNVALQHEIVARWKTARAKYPGAFLAVNACENDILGLCSCEACRAWDGPPPQGAEKFYADSPKMAGARIVSDRYARFWLALQQLAAKEDPEATVVGYAYMNYFPAPTSGIRLNPRILVGFCPSGGFFPRSADEQQWLKQQWTGWSHTGARLFDRSNCFLDGYAMPHIFAHQFADEFQHAVRCGMAATDFDSLTGQWSTQGTNLYLLARLHVRPDKAADDLLAEYYDAFGPAASQVKAYFDYWEQYTTDHRESIAGIFRRQQVSRWRQYAKLAHAAFPPAAFAPAEAILARAAEAARAEGEAAARVAFLQKGLAHAKWCARVAAQMGGNDAAAARAAWQQLVALRRATERDGIANFTHLAWVEGASWQRPTIP